MNDFIEIKANKSIKNKIKSNFNGYTNRFFWNIKFNIPLLMTSVNSETTNVTNEFGEILQAKVFYIPYDNMLVIEPHESYADDVYYFLNVSKGVCSENGQNLKNEIHIRFKLKNKKIAEIRTFKGEIRFKKVPLSIRLNLPYIRISNKFGIGMKSNYEYRMPILIFPYFILPIFICIVTFLLIPRNIDYMVGYSICIAMIILQIVVFIVQYNGKRRKSIFYHNKGVNCYNSRQLLDALDFFEKAHQIDKNNKASEEAINKVNRYLL